MLRSCSYCGRVHDTKYECPSKPKRDKERTEVDRLRSLNVWKKKRTYIKERDTYLCQICKRNLYNTDRQYNYDNLHVHHIVPIGEDKGLWLEDTNLICICSYHHELAEKGEIPREELRLIVEEQERKL